MGTKVIAFLKGLVEVLTLLVSLIDTPGGHMMTMAALMGAGGWLLHSGIMEGGSIFTGAFGALLGYITRGRANAATTTETKS